MEIETGLTQVQCKSCGTLFTIDPEEKQFFIDRLLKLPTHCAACRAKNRLARQQRARYLEQGDDGHE